MDDFQETNWWQVLDQQGRLWCETSNEEEARKSMRSGDVLYRLYEKKESRWEKQK